MDDRLLNGFSLLAKSHESHPLLAGLSRTIAVLVLASVPFFASAQSQMMEIHDLVVVTGGGHVTQFVDAAISYTDLAPAPARPGPEFSLFHAIQAGEVRSIWLQKYADEVPTWLVTLKDGSTEWVEGGEVSFSGTVVGSSWPGSVGYMSLQLGPDPNQLGAYRTVYLLPTGDETHR